MKLADKSVSDVRVKEPKLRRAFQVVTSSNTIDWENDDVSLETHDIIALIEEVKSNNMTRKFNKMEAQNIRRNY